MCVKRRWLPVHKLKGWKTFRLAQEPPLFNVAMLTPILQTLMTTKADELAQEAQLIQRRGKYTGAQFLQALTFGFLKRRGAPLESETKVRRWN